MGRTTRQFAPARWAATTLALALSLTWSTALAAQDVRRVTVELDLFTGLLATAAERVADETVDELVVDAWRPGGAVVVALGDRLEVLYGIQPGLGLVLGEAWGFGPGSDGTISLDHSTGTIHRVAGRLRLLGGLYTELGIARVGATDYAMDFERNGATMRIGQNDYATDLRVDWRTASTFRSVVGLGYQLDLLGGLRLGLGFAVPIPFGESDVASIDFAPTEAGVTISAADQSLARAALDQETFYAPIVGRVSIGYGWTLGG